MFRKLTRYRADDAGHQLSKKRLSIVLVEEDTLLYRLSCGKYSHVGTGCVEKYFSSSSSTGYRLKINNIRFGFYLLVLIITSTMQLSPWTWCIVSSIIIQLLLCVIASLGCNMFVLKQSLQSFDLWYKSANLTVAMVAYYIDYQLYKPEYYGWKNNNTHDFVLPLFKFCGIIGIIKNCFGVMLVSITDGYYIDEYIRLIVIITVIIYFGLYYVLILNLKYESSDATGNIFGYPFRWNTVASSCLINAILFLMHQCFLIIRNPSKFTTITTFIPFEKTMQQTEKSNSDNSARASIPHVTIQFSQAIINAKIERSRTLSVPRNSVDDSYTVDSGHGYSDSDYESDGSVSIATETDVEESEIFTMDSLEKEDKKTHKNKSRLNSIDIHTSETILYHVCCHRNHNDNHNDNNRGLYDRVAKYLFSPYSFFISAIYAFVFQMLIFFMYYQINGYVFIGLKWMLILLLILTLSYYNNQIFVFFVHKFAFWWKLCNVIIFCIAYVHVDKQMQMYEWNDSFKASTQVKWVLSISGTLIFTTSVVLASSVSAFLGPIKVVYEKILQTLFIVCYTLLFAHSGIAHFIDVRDDNAIKIWNYTINFRTVLIAKCIDITLFFLSQLYSSNRYGFSIAGVEVLGCIKRKWKVNKHKKLKLSNKIDNEFALHLMGDSNVNDI